MSLCSTCSSADINTYICISCHDLRMQEALDTIEHLQRELRTVTTQYSFCKFALQLKLGKHKVSKKPSNSLDTFGT